METVNFTFNGKSFSADAAILQTSAQVKALAHPASFPILKSLCSKQSFAGELALQLFLKDQVVYYVLKKLLKAGLIELASTKEVKGATAKYFKASAQAFLLVPNLESLQEQHSIASSPTKSPLTSFFHPFISKGKLSAQLIVGSSDPHGTFNARAKDAYLGFEFVALLSSLSKKINYPFTFQDTEVPALAFLNENLIILGGPITNKLALELNEYLPVYFKPIGNKFLLYSKLSQNHYGTDTIGLIAKVPHPFFKDKSILFIAGNRNSGTKAAILAFLQYPEEVAKPNKFSKKDNVSVHIVQGFDKNADGRIDAVEFLE